MPTQHRKLFLTLCLCLCCLLPLTAQAMPPFAPSSTPAAPDYSRDDAWLVKPTRIDQPVDVFFVYPTVLHNDTDWLMDPRSKALQDAAMASINRQASVFDEQANIFAPIYRQMNLAVLSLSEEHEAPIRAVAQDDVWRAFTYYLEHENGGRPFFVAGHSQGSMLLTNIMLEHWGQLGVEDRLVAALLPGWSMTKENLASNPAITMCDQPDRTGCVISYNSVAAGRQSVAPTLLPGAQAVNPLSWTMGKELVPAERNLGAVIVDAHGKAITYPNFTSAQIVDGGLVVLPEDVALVTVKGGTLFPDGVYHVFDYALFYENIRANIARRIKAMAD